MLHPDAHQNPYVRDRPELTGTPGVAMPELDTLDWSGARCAYGSGLAIPIMLRGLTSDDPDDRDWAFEGLLASIVHQGHTDSASALAVAPLLQLAKSDGPHSKADVLTLLLWLAIGDPRWFAEQGIEVMQSHQTDCFERVAEGIEAIEPLLTHPDPATRAAAAELCVHLRPTPAVREVCVQFALREPDPDALALLAVIDRRLGRQEEPVFEQRVESPSNEWLIGRAIGLAILQGRDAQPDVANVLATTAESIEDEDWGSVHAARVQALYEALALPVETDALLNVAASDHPLRFQAGLRALAALFPDPDDTALALASDLSSAQRRLLMLYADGHLSIPSLPGYVPKQRPLLQRWLGTVAGPADSLLQTDPPLPIWQALDRALTDGSTDAVVGDIIAATPDHDRVALALDLLKLTLQVAWLGDRTDMEARRTYQAAWLRSLATIWLAAPEAVAEARRRADELIHEPDVAEGQLVALVLARDCSARGAYLDPRYIALFDLGAAPVRQYFAVYRELVAALSELQRDLLLDTLLLVQASRSAVSTDDETVSAYSIRVTDWWRLLDLHSPNRLRERIHEARAQYDELLADIDTLQRSRYFSHMSDDPFPSERAGALLAVADASTAPHTSGDA